MALYAGKHRLICRRRGRDWKDCRCPWQSLRGKLKFAGICRGDGGKCIAEARKRERFAKRHSLYSPFFPKSLNSKEFIEKYLGLGWVRNIKNYFFFLKFIKICQILSKNLIYFSLFSRTLNLNSMFCFIARQNSSTSRLTSS